MVVKIYPRRCISKGIWIYSMGDTIKDWPRDLEAELRECSTVLFCGVALSLDLKHYMVWSSEVVGKYPSTGRNNYLLKLMVLGNPKYIMIVDFENPCPVNSPLLSDDVKIRNFDKYL